MAKTANNNFLINFFTTSKNVTQNPKPFLESFFLTDFENDIKTILHRQVTEKKPLTKSTSQFHHWRGRGGCQMKFGKSPSFGMFLSFVHIPYKLV